MAAVARGAARAGGEVIGVLPWTEPGEANPDCTHVVATGVGHARNLAVVGSGEVVIAIGGEWGTLSEIGHARAIGRTVVALRSWTPGRPRPDGGRARRRPGRDRRGGRRRRPRRAPSSGEFALVPLCGRFCERTRFLGWAMSTDAQSAAIRDEFAHQADSFARSPTMSLAETLGVLVDLVPEDPEARWVEIACGPGLIARAMAPRVGSVVGTRPDPGDDRESARRGGGGRGRERQLRGRRRDRARPSRRLPRRRDHPLQPPPHPGAGAGAGGDAAGGEAGRLRRRLRLRHRRRRRERGLAGTDRAPPRPLALGPADAVADRGAGRAGRASSPTSNASSPSRSTSRSG